MDITTLLQMLLSHVSQNQDILQRILKETDNEKNTPHHIAAKAKNLDVLKVKGLNIMVLVQLKRHF